jgi:hypothetical protein
MPLRSPMMRTRQPALLSPAQPVRRLWLAVALSLCLASCASDGPDSDPRPRDGLLAEAPDWVVIDCASHWDGRLGERLCGVGSSL